MTKKKKQNTMMYDSQHKYANVYINSASYNAMSQFMNIKSTESIKYCQRKIDKNIQFEFIKQFFMKELDDLIDDN